MPAESLTSIDDYEVFLTDRMTPWSPQKRLALAAGIAERWLPAYEAFSAEERWGDPASLRRNLEAIWGHVQGRTLRDKDLSRYIDQLEDVTPHMDDFDAEEALTACAILHDALRMCGDPDNSIPYLLRLVLGILEIDRRRMAHRPGRSTSSLAERSSPQGTSSSLETNRGD